MLKLTYVFPVLALTLAVACGDDEKTETGDTGETTPTDTDTDTDTGPVELMLDTIDAPVCEGGKFVFRAETQGWIGSAIINLYDLGAPPGNQWNEEHDLPSESYEPDGSRDFLELTLTPVATPAEFTPDQTTLYACGTHDLPGALVEVIRIYDDAGNLVDCGIFSNGVQGGVDEVLANPEGDNFNPVSNPSEITAANCDTFAR